MFRGLLFRGILDMEHANRLAPARRGGRRHRPSSPCRISRLSSFPVSSSSGRSPRSASTAPVASAPPSGSMSGSTRPLWSQCSVRSTERGRFRPLKVSISRSHPSNLHVPRPKEGRRTTWGMKQMSSSECPGCSAPLVTDHDQCRSRRANPVQLCEMRPPLVAGRRSADRPRRRDQRSRPARGTAGPLPPLGDRPPVTGSASSGGTMGAP